jgi:hypothetical protein
MTRLNGPFRASFAATLLGLSIPILMTGCTKSMTFPTASIAPSYNESPIQLTAGQFRPVVVISEVQDNRPDSFVGSSGNTTFKSDHEFRQFVKRELEGLLSNDGVPLARSIADAQSQSHSNRQVTASIRSASYGGASSLFHRTVAGVNLLIQVSDENGQPVFAQTYFGTSEKYPAMPNSRQSGELMAEAVRQATGKALRDSNFRAAVGL